MSIDPKHVLYNTVIPALGQEHGVRGSAAFELLRAVAHVMEQELEAFVTGTVDPPSPSDDVVYPNEQLGTMNIETGEHVVVPAWTVIDPETGKINWDAVSVDNPHHEIISGPQFTDCE